ncbi:MAG: sigma-54-dependent Fis family transcriptional regulator [Acidobacteria bacterium]|nr:sigma-54-dependent Fis family transcriptional regulator [Acidobacteriota bacterium]
MKHKLLVIDDEMAIRDTMRMLLEYDGYEVSVAASGQEGLAMVEKDSPDLVFLDVKMPGMDGLEVLSRLRGLNDALPVVIVSAHGTTTTALEAGRLGAFRFIEKPLSKDYVLDAVREGLELGSLRQENRQLRSALETRHQVIGESVGLRGITDQVRRAAPTNATVLILGESGVGKELIARAIHRNSLRAKERFVQVNCAAIPEELIESELFGHERGAFTGATDKQTGKFEQADRGTIFLDEVGDMSPKTQAKVLRVLQEGEVERLGSARTIKVDVRVIAATNKDLEEEIAEGRFRDDLYFRLSVIPIKAPPLRERLEDIPALVQHFVAQFSRENNRRPARFSQQSIEALKQARWRGNIRELKNVVERLLIMSDRDVIDGDDVRAVVPTVVRTDASASLGSGSAASPVVTGAATLRAFKEASERAWLVDKLREHGWNISKTAEEIDTPRSNLYKKLEQYGIRQEVDG